MSELRSTLHERGLRMTPQRQLVLDAVRELGHATAEQVCRRVRDAAAPINITTVYRTLDLLECLGPCYVAFALPTELQARMLWTTQ